MTSDQDWEEVEVQKSKPVGVVVSVRLPKPDADRLAEEAHRRDLPVSSLLREAINLLLSAPRRQHVNGVMRFSTESAPITFLSGPTEAGQTTGTEPRSWEHQVA